MKELHLAVLAHIIHLSLHESYYMNKYSRFYCNWYKVCGSYWDAGNQCQVGPLCTTCTRNMNSIWKGHSVNSSSTGSFTRWYAYEANSNVSCDITITRMFLCVLRCYILLSQAHSLFKWRQQQQKGVGSLNLVYKKCKCCVFFICKYDTW